MKMNNFKFKIEVTTFLEKKDVHKIPPEVQMARKEILELLSQAGGKKESESF